MVRYLDAMSSNRSGRAGKPGRLSMGSAPLTVGSLNPTTTRAPVRFVNASMANGCRFSLSFSAPTLAAYGVVR
jgi:hypothetical protein